MAVDKNLVSPLFIESTLYMVIDVEKIEEPKFETLVSR